MYYIDDNINGLNLEAAIMDISEQRMAQTMKFKHELGRRQCVASYLLLKEALSSEYGIEENPLFDYLEGGKPVLRNNPDIHFNISHCRIAVAVAVSDEPIGIDIETIRPYKDDLARHVLSDSEYESVVSSSKPDVEFIKLWTRKEAVLKLSGEGIRRDLRTLLTGLENTETIVDEVKGYVCTIAMK